MVFAVNCKGETMENTSLYNNKQHRPFTAFELFKLLCRYTQCQWDVKHTPVAMRIYTRSGVYTFEADNPEHYFKEG